MKPIIKKWTVRKNLDKPDKLMANFMDKEKYKVYRMYNNSPDNKQIKSYLLNQLIDFYYKTSLQKANQNKVELLYVNKK